MIANNKKIGPLISIITVVRNDVANIEETILSVINQNYENIEYIVIDGESNDGTVDIIRKFESSIQYWISEPDKGIYYAMNKGADIAKGDFITFMNSADRYLTTDVFDNITEACFIPTIYKTHLGKDNLVKLRNKKHSIPYCHQGIVFKNMNIKYDLQYKYAADYDYFLKHGYDVLPFSSSGKVFYDNRGLSSNSWEARKELSLIIKKNFGFYYGTRSFFLFSLKYVVIKLIYFFK
ncbi:glycosyltransferase [Candidatus Thioglobus sp.]|nr:glycosyltransferase [Candidatus Thioglobus sp.]